MSVLAPEPAVQTSSQARVWPGAPAPLGAHPDGAGVNFALLSEHAARVEVCLFARPDDPYEAERILLPERTGHVWRATWPAHRSGPRGEHRMDGLRFDALVRRFDRKATRRGLTIAVALLAGDRLGGFDHALAKGKKTKKKCKRRCIPPQFKCTNKCHKCCPDSQGNARFCELVPVCPESADGKYCCGKEGAECRFTMTPEGGGWEDCDCCGDLQCLAGKCCVGAGVVCDDTTVCCGACEGGECCTLAGNDCWEPEDCCAGMSCEGMILSPLTPGTCV